MRCSGRKNEAPCRSHCACCRSEDHEQTPAWVGSIPEKGCGNYYQYSNLNGQFYLEYMLFPEEQLSGETDFRMAVTWQELSIETIALNGEKYLRVPLGMSASEAISIGMKIVNRACGMTDDTPVEESSKGV
jgi:hypothetical protein